MAIHSKNIITSCDQKFNQWLAGFFDANGSYIIKKKKNFSFFSCYIKIPFDFIKSSVIFSKRLGGKIIENKKNKYIYVLNKDADIVNLIHKINGNIRSTQRISGFIKMCTFFNIVYLPAIPLTLENGWYSGFFDAKGVIVADWFAKYRGGFTFKFSDKHLKNVKFFNVFGGDIIFLKTNYGGFMWKITDNFDIIFKYFSQYPLKSSKHTSYLFLLYKFKRNKLIKN